MSRAAPSPFHLFGIRHHGPGCARSLLRALEALQPDCVLVEGPADGEEMLALIDDPALRPPVALLVYDPERPAAASFHPYADFSPEWIALRHAHARGIPARLIDLPAGVRFALARPPVADGDAAPATAPEAAAAPEATVGEDEDDDALADDPLDWLGRAAGHADGEAWWNQLVEERGDSLELFAAIREAIATMRTEAPARARSAPAERLEALREAHMRRAMRQARKDGHQRIAVVCGAWHLPALAALPPARADDELLKGLPKTRVAATWVPWSYRRLSSASGYGAGIDSPAWYEHLWHNVDPQQRATSWLARAARLFRDAGLDCSSAHVVEAVRLADALAALRERPQPGLAELEEALRSVVCMGEDAPLRLIRDQLVIGDRLGSTPAAAPAVPLQRDLERAQKRLRLKPEALRKTLDLDLRQPNELARSHLFHRLGLLDIGWAQLERSGRGAKGSFHELWSLQWEPELALAVIEAARWGNTVAGAATACAIARAQASDSLADLAALIDRVLLAELADALAPVARALEDRAAVASDVGQLLGALPPLANIARYGNVRRTDAGMVGHLLDSLVPRAAIGLADACRAIDDTAAAALCAAIVAAQRALHLVEREHLLAPWRQTLARVADLADGHARVCGLAARLLFDDRVEAAGDSARRMSRALSAGNPPAAAAAWLEGFLDQGGMVLLHDDGLWSVVDDWLAGLADEHFMRVLPLLRRTFATFDAPVRRQLGERARRPAAAVTPATAIGWHAERAARALPLLRQLLGVAP